MEAVRHMLERANEEMVTIRSMTVEVHDMIEEGDRTIVRMTHHYDTANGSRKYSNECIGIFELRGDRITGITAAFDRQLMYQLGLYKATSPAEA
jgi:ketosteroid isomerase-like protein